MEAAVSYRIERNRGSRWYDFPYKVTYDIRYVGQAMTFRGARRLVRKDKRRLSMGTTTVWEER
jgi:hypothetical protein